jgi:hypothetical protein
VNVVETALIFAGIPIVVVGIAYLSVYGRADVGQRNSRYRPGRPWVFAPVWYVSQEISTDHGPSRAMAHELVEGRPEHLALPGSSNPTKAVGGASGEW